MLVAVLRQAAEAILRQTGCRGSPQTDRPQRWSRDRQASEAGSGETLGAEVRVGRERFMTLLVTVTRYRLMQLKGVRICFCSQFEGGPSWEKA